MSIGANKPVKFNMILLGANLASIARGLVAYAFGEGERAVGTK
jgi:hypothetical protein